MNSRQLSLIKAGIYILLIISSLWILSMNGSIPVTPEYGIDVGGENITTIEQTYGYISYTGTLPPYSVDWLLMGDRPRTVRITLFGVEPSRTPAQITVSTKRPLEKFDSELALVDYYSPDGNCTLSSDDEFLSDTHTITIKQATGPCSIRAIFVPKYPIYPSGNVLLNLKGSVSNTQRTMLTVSPESGYYSCDKGSCMVPNYRIYHQNEANQMFSFEGRDSIVGPASGNNSYYSANVVHRDGGDIYVSLLYGTGSRHSFFGNVLLLILGFCLAQLTIHFEPTISMSMEYLRSAYNKLQSKYT
ncbi:hypothetical protein [Haloferax sp. YSSS75]|uniref:hypothetical protein n=1 Tax=Haloferax sp. YSSS75 TaxID=3388564 RepID=UPI00398CD9B3